MSRFEMLQLVKDARLILAEWPKDAVAYVGHGRTFTKPDVDRIAKDLEEVEDDFR